MVMNQSWPAFWEPRMWSGNKHRSLGYRTGATIKMLIRFYETGEGKRKDTFHFGN